MQPRTRSRAAVVVIATALSTVLGGCGGAEPAPVGPSVAAGPSALAPPCADAYSGAEQCAGELVQVATVVDAATIVLTDGRQVRLAGVQAPSASGCAGPGSLNLARQLVVGQSISLLRPASFGADQFGSLWAYVRYGPGFGQDLGMQLARQGWALSTSATPAANDYLQQVGALANTAQAAALGQFSSICAAPPAPVVANPVPNLRPVPNLTVAPRRTVAPQPRPAPKPTERPRPDPDRTPDTRGDPDRDSGSGTRSGSGDASTGGHTGHTGHPCLPGERDGDHDGYCGEGR